MTMSPDRGDRERDKFKETPVGEKTAVRVCNDPSDALTVVVSGATAGLPVFLEDQRVSNPAATETVITNVVPGGKTHALTRCTVTCRQNVVFQVKIGATVVGSGRTGPGKYSDTFIWSPNRSAAAGATVSVDIIAKAPASDVETYLQIIET